MDNKKVSEGRNDIGRTLDGEQCDYKLEVLGKHIEELSKNILSTRNCWDYVVNEVNNSNNRIIKEILWNQKRLELLKEVSDKLCKLSDEKNDCFNEYMSLINLEHNVNKLKL